MSIYTQRLRKSQGDHISPANQTQRQQASQPVADHHQDKHRDNHSQQPKKPEVEFFEVNEDEYRKKGTVLKLRIQHGRGRMLTNQKKILTIRPFIPDDADENIMVPDFTIEHTATSLAQVDDDIKEGDFIYCLELANGRTKWVKDAERSEELHAQHAALLNQQVKKKRIMFNIDRLLSENGLALLFYDLPLWCQLKSSSLPTPIGSTGVLAPQIAESNLHVLLTYVAEWKKVIAPNSSTDDFIAKCQRFGSASEVFTEALRLTDIDLEKIREKSKALQEKLRTQQHQHQRLTNLSKETMKQDQGEELFDAITPINTPVKMNPRITKFNSIIDDSDDEYDYDYHESFGSRRKRKPSLDAVGAMYDSSNSVSTPARNHMSATSGIHAIPFAAPVSAQAEDDEWFQALQQQHQQQQELGASDDLTLYTGSTNDFQPLPQSSTNPSPADADIDLELELGLID